MKIYETTYADSYQKEVSIDWLTSNTKYDTEVQTEAMLLTQGSWDEVRSGLIACSRGT